ncbi:MAG TPA: sulfur carrier protein ThiS [Bryobacteraceae bacterium]|nr:sulfur carrier protein ThiS [Bryobacteraceae bacterium]
MEVAETKTIEIVVNGQPRRVPEGLSVARLLDFLKIDRARVAVELNREIARKTAWESSAIYEGARVEIVWFVGGG